MAKPPARIYMHIGGLALVLVAAGVLIYYSPNTFSVEYNKTSAQEKKDIGTPSAPAVPASAPNQTVVTHIQTPEAVKSIYMSQCVVGTPGFRDKLVAIAENTEINSIIIDIKDFTGKISFPTDNPKLVNSVSDACGARDMKAFIDRLHKDNIYVIGRITVFQDPYMSKLRPDLAVRKKSDGGVWKDHKGLSFIDVGAKEHWAYIAEISKEAYKIGFDELNYDYIRYPSDGDMSDTDYTLSRGKTKPEMLEEFFTYLREQLQPVGVVMSADLFGMTTTSHDDLGIGQVLEKALPHFDFIDPMVYPSHYPPHFNGWAGPNKFPGQVVNFAMASAVQRANALDHSYGTSSPEYNAQSYKKLRPWLQDFDYGGNYDIPEVKAQIQATYDVGLTSWMLWASSNIYTQGALQPNLAK